jgi:hypothetical protein
VNTTTVNFRLSCEILRNFVVQNTPLGEIPLFCRSDNRFYRTRTAFTRILLEKVTFFIFIRKIGRFKYKSGDLSRNREPPDQIGRVGTFGINFHVTHVHSSVVHHAGDLWQLARGYEICWHTGVISKSCVYLQHIFKNIEVYGLLQHIFKNM